MIQGPTDPEFLREWTDEQLLAEYERSTGEDGDPQAMKVLAEIQRRNLDV